MPIVSLNPQRRPLENPADAELVRPALTSWPLTKKPDADVADQPSQEDPLLAFHSEQGQTAPARRAAAESPAALPSFAAPARAPSRSPRLLAFALLTLVIGAAGIISYSRFRSAAGSGSEAAGPSSAAEGRTIINSNPRGALVFIDGVARGATPLDLMVPVGTHTLQLQNGASIRTLPLDVQTGQSSSHYIELAAPGAAGEDSPPLPPAPRASAPATSTPPTAPAPRPQAVSRAARQAPAEAPRPPSSTANLSTPPPASIAPPSAAAEGWASIDVPFAAQITENGRPLGSTGGGPVRLGAGVHTLELANATYEFRATLTVTVTSGETTRLPVTLPLGSLSVNALPWAEVFVDGRPIGTTPLANIPVPIGSREILWRHPDFGDRRQLIDVTARTPVRLGTDFSR